MRRRHVVGAVLLPVLLAATPALAADDPYRPQQWSLDRVGAPDAWEQGRGAGEVIAIVDSGVDLEHPDLVDRFVRDEAGAILGRDVVDGDDDPTDELGHGTMVAGIAAATGDNGIGISGVAPEARILPVRVLDEEGSGSSADVDEGIRWAVDNGATVVNLSLESAGRVLEGPLLGGLTAPVAAVEYAAEHGVVVVAAAGNSGNAFTDYPSSSPVVLVGSTDRDDQRSTFSDSGRDDLLMAPGVDIVSTWCRATGSSGCDGTTHNYGIADGTSFSAPQVAGAVAVLRSLGLEGPEAVRVLRDSAVDLEEPGRDEGTGQGRLDLAAAAAAATSTPSPSPSVPAGGPTSASSGSPSTAPSPSPSASPGTGPPPSTPPPSSPSPSPPPQTATPSEPGSIATPDGTDPTVVPPALPSPQAAPPPDDGSGRAAWTMLAGALVAVAAAAQLVARRSA